MRKAQACYWISNSISALVKSEMRREGFSNFCSSVCRKYQQEVGFGYICSDKRNQHTRWDFTHQSGDRETSLLSVLPVASRVNINGKLDAVWTGWLMSMSQTGWSSWWWRVLVLVYGCLVFQQVQTKMAAPAPWWTENTTDLLRKKKKNLIHDCFDEYICDG